MNQYTTLKSGSNSSILSYGQEGDRIILKVVPALYPKEQGHLKNEYEFLRNLSHRNVVQSLKYSEKVGFPGTNHDNQLPQHGKHDVLILEYAAKGSLFDYLKTQKPSISVKRLAFKSISQGLAYLHFEGIAHRDLKLQNILVFLQNGILNFKISDFGFASYFLQNGQRLKFKDYKGTRTYMAPEILQCAKNRKKEYDAAKADIFALGVVLFSLVFEQYPFERALSSDTNFKYLKKKQFGTFWSYFEIQQYQLQAGYRLQELKDLFQKMTSYNPEQRPSIHQIVKHKWLLERVITQQL